MPRPRTPTAVLEASGAFAKNPARGRARSSEPKSPGGVGDPPECFKPGGEFAQLWHEISASAPWLDSANRGSLESLCRIRYNIRHSYGKLNANIGAQSKLENDLGITQASRSRCNVPSKPPERETGPGGWKDLAEEGRRARPN